MNITIDNPRPWQIGVPAPTDRLIEIHAEGANLIAHYIKDGDRYMIGADSTIAAEHVTRWRELSPEQAAHFSPLA